MQVYQTEGPAVEAVSLKDVKDFLKITEVDDDSLLIGLIYANTTLIEQYLNRSLITQKWELSIDSYPWKDRIKLYNGPIQSIESVTTYDVNNVGVVFSSAKYRLSEKVQKPELVLGYSQIWPTTVTRPTEGVKILYTSGYGDDPDTVPAVIQHALMLLIASDYENREFAVSKADILDSISMMRVRSI